jgi:hypothetical protein
MAALPGSWVRLVGSLILVLLLAGLALRTLDSRLPGQVGRLLQAGSLLGRPATVRERCLYEYNLTLSFAPTMGRWAPGQADLCRTVMLDRGGVELMCSLVGPAVSVLEYGSGGSTTFFRCRLAWSAVHLICPSASLRRAGSAWSMMGTGLPRWPRPTLGTILHLFQVLNILPQLPWGDKVESVILWP